MRATYLFPGHITLVSLERTVIEWRFPLTYIVLLHHKYIHRCRFGKSDTKRAHQFVDEQMVR